MGQYTNKAILLLGLLVTGCRDQTPTEAAPETLEKINITNPIGLFCGADCGDCNHDVNTCLKVLKHNLSSICGQAGEKDCYTTWVKYSKTCQYLCQKSPSRMEGAARLVNLVNESEPPSTA